MNTEATLRMFYANDAEPTLEDRLSAIVRHTPTPEHTAQDAINWKEHVRRYHNGSFDPRVEKCEVYERMKRAEEESEILNHADSDGDGVDDDYSQFSDDGDKSDSEEDDAEGGEGEGDGEVDSGKGEGEGEVGGEET